MRRVSKYFFGKKQAVSILVEKHKKHFRHCDCFTRLCSPPFHLLYLCECVSVLNIFCVWWCVHALALSLVTAAAAQTDESILSLSFLPDNSLLLSSHRLNS